MTVICEGSGYFQQIQLKDLHCTRSFCFHERFGQDTLSTFVSQDVCSTLVNMHSCSMFFLKQCI